MYCNKLVFSNIISDGFTRKPCKNVEGGICIAVCIQRAIRAKREIVTWSFVYTIHSNDRGMRATEIPTCMLVSLRIFRNICETLVSIVCINDACIFLSDNDWNAQSCDFLESDRSYFSTFRNSRGSWCAHRLVCIVYNEKYYYWYKSVQDQLPSCESRNPCYWCWFISNVLDISNILPC